MIYLLGSGGCIAFALEQAGLFQKNDAKKWLNASLEWHFEQQPLKVQIGPTRDGFGKHDSTWHQIVINRALKEYHRQKGTSFTFTKTAVEAIPALLRHNKKLILDGQLTGAWISYNNPDAMYHHFDVDDPMLDKVLFQNKCYRHCVFIDSKLIYDMDGNKPIADLCLGRDGQPRTKGYYPQKSKKMENV